jgi:PAS domain S-box-containing protein
MSDNGTEIGTEIGTNEILRASKMTMRPITSAAWKSIFKMAMVIFLVECLLMVIFQYMPIPYWLKTISGAGVLAVLSSAFIYKTVIKTLSQTMVSRSEAVLRSMSEGVVVQDHLSVIEQFNPAALRILSLSEDQLMGRTSMDPRWRAVREDGSDFPGQEHPAMLAIATGRSIHNTIMGVHQPDGPKRWISINAVPIFESRRDRPDRVVTTFADITQKRLADQKLKMCLVATGMGCWTWEFATQKVEFDEAASRVTGWRDVVAISDIESWKNLLHGDDRDRVSVELREAWAGGRPFDSKFRFMLNGQIHWMAARGIVERDDFGKPVQLTCIQWDITEEMLARKQVDDLRRALDDSAIVSITDKKGIIKFANKKFTEVSGYSAVELVGRSHNVVNSGTHPKSFFAEIWQTIMSGQQWQGEICNRHKDGSLYWVESYILPIMNTDGSIEQFISIRYDITKKRMVEQSLVQSAKMSSLGEMAGGIAHEINNPLAIISAKCHSLRLAVERGTATADKMGASITKIEETVARIAKIIRGLRSFARESAGDPFEVVAAHALIEETLSLCMSRMGNHSVEVRHAMDQSKPLNIECRAVEVSQILLNLINNSFDAIVQLPNPWIKLDCLDLGDFVEFRVSDCGPGIPVELRESIMQPFFTTKEVGKGTGLGLSISAGLAKAHGGELTLDPLSANTCFVLRLPKRQPQAPVSVASVAE